jgi:hypothetical protein
MRKLITVTLAALATTAALTTLSAPAHAQVFGIAGNVSGILSEVFSAAGGLAQVH